MEPRILGLGRAVPRRRYTQGELLRHNPWGDNPLIQRLFVDAPVHSRALFVPPEWYLEGGPRGLSDTNAAWREGALLLGGRALEDALVASETEPTAVDMIGVTTVTGYATPGLDLLLAKAHGLRRDVARAHFNCIGCHAAVPLLKVVADHVRARPEQRAAAVAVEVCSACFTLDPDPQNLVALSLFGDGAASVIVGTDGDGPAIVGFSSLYDFDHLDALGFGLTADGFRIVLDPAIPDLIGQHVQGAVDALLDAHDVRREQVSLWAFHPGGSRILDAVQRRLELSDPEMAPSRRVLRAYGNMSSPSVLFVLAEALGQARSGGSRGYAPKAEPPAGRFGVLAAFGPGLGIEAALLRFS